MKEERRRQEQEAEDKKAQMEVSSLATTIMIRDGLSWHEALEAAKKEIEAEYNSEVWNFI